MKASIVLLSLCALPAWAQSPKPAAPPPMTLELGGGVGYADATAPVVAMRLGTDVAGGWLSPAVRAFWAAGAQGHRTSDSDPTNAPGYRGWGAFAELRFQPPLGAFRPYLGLGVGLGKLIDTECDCSEVAVEQGRTGLYLQGSLGARYELGALSLGLEGVLQRYDHVSGGGSFSPMGTPVPDTSEHSLIAVQTLFTVGYRFGG